MTDQLDLQPVLSFCKHLEENNDRVWFNSHRDQYKEARSIFEQYIAILIKELSQTESLGGITPKDCIFRLNRDLRFTKDKTPYKPYLSAYIAPGGRKSRRLGFYVHIEPGDRSMFAGGIHEPEPQQINAWRAAIDRDPQAFMAIAEDSTFRRYFGAANGEKLKTAPRGYSRDHPQLDLLRLKSVTVSRSISDSLVNSPQLVPETLETFAAMRPFLRYLETLG
jgi:uncharacterized protein (TIGR02453 family)